MLNDPFDRAALPRDFSRADRVRLLGEAAHDLLAGRMPSDAARLFVAGGLAAWLEQDGDLLRDYWRVKAPAGSHHTPAHLWEQCSYSSRGTTTEPEAETMHDTISTTQEHP